jgi:hypothetical protein
VSFKEMQLWNQHNRVINYSHLIYKKDDDDTIKYDLLKDWQGVLSDRWVDMLFDTTLAKDKEPWFNNNLRKFIITFLERYEKLDKKGKDEFKNNVKALIKYE